MSDELKSTGQVAYEAQKQAWPKHAEGYVPWEHLTQEARNGWQVVADAVKSGINPYEVWLHKSQELLRDVRYWISNGLSEKATQEITNYWKEWSNER